MVAIVTIMQKEKEKRTTQMEKNGFRVFLKMVNLQKAFGIMITEKFIAKENLKKAILYQDTLKPLTGGNLYFCFAIK